MAGIFTAVCELRQSRRLGCASDSRLRETLGWFNEHLPVPGCCGADKNPRACWFKPTAGEPLTRMWRLVEFLHSEGTLVQLHKTKDPGKLLYSDPFQIVAILRAKPQVRTFQLR